MYPMLQHHCKSCKKHTLQGVPWARLWHEVKSSQAVEMIHSKRMQLPHTVTCDYFNY